MNAYLIKKPVITERSLSLAEKQNVYTFEVQMDAKKGQIKAVVEELFSVKVMSVNTVVRHRIKKKTGRKRMSTISPKSKKAYVKLAEGNTIDLFDVGGNN
jgi:large subunit ribosomal protein L23